MTVFGYLILISIDFYDFMSPFFSFVLVLIEKIYQTLETVFHWLSKHLEFYFFEFYSQSLDILMKHCLSCLIYYLKQGILFINFADPYTSVVLFKYNFFCYLVPSQYGQNS